MQRRAAFYGALLSVTAAATAAIGAPMAQAEEGSFPRLHGGALVGGGFANAGSTWVGGVAMEGALGARFAEGFTIDATLMLENCLFCGRSNVGAIASFEPGRVLLLGLGGGVGGLYFLRFGYGPNTASYGFGVARAALRFDHDRGGVLLVGADGIVGATYAGTAVDDSGFETARPMGTLVGGGRLFFGFETE
ncbi:MAG: hypothetical protein U0414_26590 [Polyangiaceae bacterium]